MIKKISSYCSFSPRPLIDLPYRPDFEGSRETKVKAVLRRQPGHLARYLLAIFNYLFPSRVGGFLSNVSNVSNRGKQGGLNSLIINRLYILLIVREGVGKRWRPHNSLQQAATWQPWRWRISVFSNIVGNTRIFEIPSEGSYRHFPVSVGDVGDVEAKTGTLLFPYTLFSHAN